MSNDKPTCTTCGGTRMALLPMPGSPDERFEVNCHACSPPAGKIKRYAAESFDLRCNFDGVPFMVRMRLMLDRDNRRVRAVRSVKVTAEDGSKLPTTDDAYIDDQESS